MCILSNNIYDYVNVSQGKITIPNVDDGEECSLTDVSALFSETISHESVMLSEPHQKFKLFLSLYFVIHPHKFTRFCRNFYTLFF